MLKYRPLILILVIAVLTGGLIVAKSRSNSNTPVVNSSPAPSASASTPSDPNAITISDYTFSPASLTVKKGTSVTWTNKDIARHSITSDSGGMPNGPLFGQNQTYSYTFDTVGTYTYHCEPHPYMKATVTVTQ